MNNNSTLNAERNICVNSVWKHFKGEYYKFICVAKHSETEEELVVYEHISNSKIYARPIDMFLSKVDKEKYPNATQEYRFEEVGGRNDT